VVRNSGRVIGTIPKISVAVADAGPDSFGFESGDGYNYVVHLDGTGSLGATQYLWEQIGGIPVTLRNADTATPDFDAPRWDGSTELTQEEATLIFRLTVDSGKTDETQVHVRIPGDANGDNAVNAFDVALVRNVDPCADFDGDGRVTGFDVAILRTNSGRRRTVE